MRLWLGRIAILFPLWSWAHEPIPAKSGSDGGEAPSRQVLDQSVYIVDDFEGAQYILREPVPREHFAEIKLEYKSLFKDVDERLPDTKPDADIYTHLSEDRDAMAYLGAKKDLLDKKEQKNIKNEKQYKSYCARRTNSQFAEKNGLLHSEFCEPK